VQPRPIKPFLQDSSHHHHHQSHSGSVSVLCGVLADGSLPYKSTPLSASRALLCIRGDALNAALHAHINNQLPGQCCGCMVRLINVIRMSAVSTNERRFYNWCTHPACLRETVAHASLAALAHHVAVVHRGAENALPNKRCGCQVWRLSLVQKKQRDAGECAHAQLPSMQVRGQGVASVKRVAAEANARVLNLHLETTHLPITAC
jgi:hypothetical protein